MGRFTRYFLVTGMDSKLPGGDFRSADLDGTTLYSVTDTGNTYRMHLNAMKLGATLVSTLTAGCSGRRHEAR